MTRDLPLAEEAHENARMKLRVLFASTLTLILEAQLCLAGASVNWAGQYADKKFLGGRAVFQLTIEQSGSATQVSFDAAWADGHGADRTGVVGEGQQIQVAQALEVSPFPAAAVRRTGLEL